MAVSFDVGGGENVPGIPSACATHKFTYLVRSPWSNTQTHKHTHWRVLHTISHEIILKVSDWFYGVMIYRQLMLCISVRTTSYTQRHLDGYGKQNSILWVKAAWYQQYNISAIVNVPYLYQLFNLLISGHRISVVNKLGYFYQQILA